MANVRLIPNWKKAWRMASMHVAAGAVAFSTLPPDLQAALMAAVGLPVSAAPGVLGALMMLARLVDQPKAR